MASGEPAGQSSRRGPAYQAGVEADGTEVNGALLWMAERLATNRERIGVHYPSDSLASRHLAGGIWNGLINDTGATRIHAPTLRKVLNRARAEWA